MFCGKRAPGAGAVAEDDFGRRFMGTHSVLRPRKTAFKEIALEGHAP